MVDVDVKQINFIRYAEQRGGLNTGENYERTTLQRSSVWQQKKKKIVIQLMIFFQVSN